MVEEGAERRRRRERLANGRKGLKENEDDQGGDHEDECQLEDTPTWA
jgi:hypothetical protein